jgi:hypothetical protein
MGLFGEFFVPMKVDEYNILEKNIGKLSNWKIKYVYNKALHTYVFRIRSVCKEFIDDSIYELERICKFINTDQKIYGFVKYFFYENSSIGFIFISSEYGSLKVNNIPFKEIKHDFFIRTSCVNAPNFLWFDLQTEFDIDIEDSD